MLPKGKYSYEVDKLAYVIPHEYNPDFTVTKKDGTKMYIEVKGYFRYEDQVKMKAVKFNNPHADIRFFFPEDKPIHKGKMLNSQWCQKYGFPCAIGKIPKNWFKK